MPDGPGSFYGFVLGVLAVWRVTHLLHVEHGPWGVFARVRAAFGRLGAGEAFTCFYCLSLWVALPVAMLLASTWVWRGMIWLALSAGAILFELRALGDPPTTDSERS